MYAEGKSDGEVAMNLVMFQRKMSNGKVVPVAINPSRVSSVEPSGEVGVTVISFDDAGDIYLRVCHDYMFVVTSLNGN
jgi:hypothetical protein